MVLGFLFGRKKEDKVKFHSVGSNKKQAKKSKLKPKPKPKSKTKTTAKLKPKPKSKLKPNVKAIKKNKKVKKAGKEKEESKLKRIKKPLSRIKRRVVKTEPVVKRIPPKEVLIGKITHFFAKPSAGVIKLLKRGISLDEKIHIKGRHTNFIQNVFSLQIDNKPVDKAGRGEEVGLEVKERVRRKDKVYVFK